MNRYTKLTVFAFSILLLFSACKKGSEDKFLSLLSRKARITGTWELIEASGADKNFYNGTTEITTYVVSNGQFTTTESGNSHTIGLEYTLKFDKKGAYERVKTENNDGLISVETEKGSWSFLGKNKDADQKNKEFLGFFLESTTNETPNYSESWGYIMSTFIDSYELVRLTNKELIVRVKTNSTSNVNSDLESFESEMRMVFKKK